MKIFFHCSAVSCKLKVSFIWFTCNLRKLPDAWFFKNHVSGNYRTHDFSMHPVNCTESGKIQKLSFFHKFWAHSIKQMMHRFYSWVGRTCVHAVPLNFVRNPLGCASWVQTIQRYCTLCTQFPTDPQKLVHHLLYTVISFGEMAI